MRIRLSEWGDRNYSQASMPAPGTLRRMAERGDVPGSFKDSVGHWWVEVQSLPVSDVRSQIDKMIGDDKTIRDMIA